VGYRVNEVLFGQNNVAVGRTHDITGSITLSGTDVEKAGFTVQMSTVHSDESQRDNQFDGRIMDVSEFPTSKFVLSSPIDLGSSANLHAGDPISATATGELTLRGQTHSVTFPLTASYTATGIDINGSIPITFATWDIPNPGFGSAITTDNHGILEFLLVLKSGSAAS
jgi:polyisoprenoid-binding protein YceI